MNNLSKPFDCEYSPQFTELHQKLGISSTISTYQVRKVIILSAEQKDRLIQLPHTLNHQMAGLLL